MQMRCPFRLMALALLGCVNAWQASAQSLRDPTQPPAAYNAPVGGARVALDTFKPQHLMVVEGVRYLVWNNHRYKVGETIDGARIERISESEVWLRRADAVRKIPLFSGIEKRPPNGGAPTKTSTRSTLDGKNGLTK